MSLNPVSQEKSLDIRQLRHQTKNALASILAQLSHGGADGQSRRLAADVERRILLTSQIADALFGLTRAPGPFPDRLLTLCEGVIDLIGEPDQVISLLCRVEGTVPEPVQELVLRVAHELVVNAVKHGMCLRLIGRIEVTVLAGPDGVVLDVSDDGWGCGPGKLPGEGLAVANALAGSAGGRVALRREGERTVAELRLPAVRQDA